ncbi:hypothetical protein [Picosynechococcus sp. NKBG15041c]|nr:hypothetical protein [Picosynechococcus sp. NKBG15041c]
MGSPVHDIQRLRNVTIAAPEQRYLEQSHIGQHFLGRSPLPLE